MKCKTKYIIIFIQFFLLLDFYETMAQPVFHSKFTIDEEVLFKDYKDSSIYYYQPKEIYLYRDSEGKPGVNYLRMVKSQVKGGNNISLSNFNVMQLRFKSKKISKDRLEKIKNTLRNSNITLNPLTLKKTEFFLLKGSTSVARKIPIADHLDASYEGFKESIDWNDKKITLRLSAEATQIINANLLKEDNLGIVFSYTFYADFVDQMSTSTNLEIEQKDSLKMQLSSFKSGQVDLSFDIEKWKDKCIKDLILNEEILPRYHPIAVQNFDFKNNLRPELIATKVMVCGQGLGNKRTCSKELEFSEKSTHAYNLKFKFPILLTKPLEYKIKEITRDGKLIIKDWVKIDLGQTIDITSEDVNQKFKQQYIDVETDIQEMIDAGYKSVELDLLYSMNQKDLSKKIVFDAQSNEGSIRTNFSQDKNASFKYSITWLRNDDKVVVGDNSQDILDVGYIYLSPVKE